MKIWKLCMSIVAAMLFVIALSFTLVSLLPSHPADASSVMGYQTVVVEDGTVAYTTTTYSSGYMVGSFGEVVLQVESDISQTRTLTVTPQFSNDARGCGSAVYWVDGAIVQTYGTSSLSYGSVAVRAVVAGDGDKVIRFPTMGRCMRVRMEISSTAVFTPAVFAWMVNTQ